MARLFLCPRCRKPTLKEYPPELRHVPQWNAAGEEMCSHARIRRQHCQDERCGFRATRASLFKLHPYCGRLRRIGDLRAG